MQEKNFIGRFSQKIDTTENWDSVADTFIPLKGEIIVYQDDPTNSSSKIKIGDGNTPVGKLAFLTGEAQQTDSVEPLIVWINQDGDQATHSSPEILEAVQAGRAVYLRPYADDYLVSLEDSNPDASIFTSTSAEEGSMFTWFVFEDKRCEYHEKYCVDDYNFSELSDKVQELEEDFNSTTGDIEAALDAIIAIQEELIGTITFYITGIEYTAKKGMTWAEWVDSEYNTGNYIVRNGEVGWWEWNEDYGDNEWWWVEAPASALIIAGRDYDVGA